MIAEARKGIISHGETYPIPTQTGILCEEATIALKAA